MDCTQVREALSAALDGEECPAAQDEIDAHLVVCVACCRFADDVAYLSQIAHTDAASDSDAVAGLVVSIDGLAMVVQALTDLDRDSTSCATAMMAHSTPDMLSATRAALDCADIAAAAQRVLSRPTATDISVVRAILVAAATAADRCVSECSQHASHHGHCRTHSQSAQRAAHICRSELAKIAG